MKKVFVAMFILIVFVVGVFLGAMVQREGIESKRTIAVCDEYDEKVIVEYKVVNLFDVETKIIIVDTDTNEVDSELRIFDGNIYTVDY